MSDNYDGPAMAQQIIRLQARVKELEAQILAIVNTDTKCYDENAKLRKVALWAQAYRNAVVCDDDINAQLYCAATNLDEALRELDGNITNHNT